MLALFCACTEDSMFSDETFKEQESACKQIQLSFADANYFATSRSANLDVQNSSFAQGTSFSILTLDESGTPLAEDARYKLSADGHTMLPESESQRLFYQRIGKVQLYAIAPADALNMTKANAFNTTATKRFTIPTDQSTDANVIKADLLVGMPRQGNPFRNEMGPVELEFKHAFTRLSLTVRVPANEALVCDAVHIKAKNACYSALLSISKAFSSSLSAMFLNANTPSFGDISMMNSMPITKKEIQDAIASGKNYVERKCECVIIPDINGNHAPVSFQIALVVGGKEKMNITRTTNTSNLYLPGKTYSYIMNVTPADLKLDVDDWSDGSGSLAPIANKIIE